MQESFGVDLSNFFGGLVRTSEPCNWPFPGWSGLVPSATHESVLLATERDLKNNKLTTKKKKNEDIPSV